MCPNTQFIRYFNASLQELLKTKKYSVGTVDGSAPYDKFSSARNDSIYHRVYEELFSKEGLVASPDEGAEKARADPNYAFIWNTITMPNQGGCEFLEVGKIMHRLCLSVTAIDKYRLNMSVTLASKQFLNFSYL